MENEFSRQSSHAVPASLANLPAVHALQSPLPVPDVYSPMPEQSVHTPAALPLLLPAAHGVHAEVFSLEDVPASQGVHAARPAEEATKPGSHCLHGLSPPELRVPAGQAVHLMVTESLEFPGAQYSQAWEEAEYE